MHSLINAGRLRYGKIGRRRLGIHVSQLDPALNPHLLPSDVPDPDRPRPEPRSIPAPTPSMIDAWEKIAAMPDPRLPR